MADTATRLPKRLTLREFLEWEERQPGRYELLDGLVRAMAGGDQAHSAVKRNILTALHNRLNDGPCRAFDSDLKVLAANNSYYPDAIVDCGEPNPRSRHASSPTIVFEVLSPSTREDDFALKLPNYQATPSIKQIVYVEVNRMHVMLWLRTDAGWVEDEVVHPDGAVTLEPISESLPLSEIYTGVRFG